MKLLRAASSRSLDAAETGAASIGSGKARSAFRNSRFAFRSPLSALARSRISNASRLVILRGFPLMVTVTLSRHNFSSTLDTLLAPLGRLQPHRGDRGHPEKLGGLDAAVASDNGVIAVRQNRAGKAKGPDAVGNHFDLAFAVSAGVSCERPQGDDRDVRNRQVGAAQRLISRRVCHGHLRSIDHLDQKSSFFVLAIPTLFALALSCEKRAGLHPGSRLGGHSDGGIGTRA